MQGITVRVRWVLTVCQHYAEWTHTQAWRYTHLYTRAFALKCTAAFRQECLWRHERIIWTHEQTARTHLHAAANRVSHKSRSDRPRKGHWFHTTTRWTTFSLAVPHLSNRVHIKLAGFDAWKLPNNSISFWWYVTTFHGCKVNINKSYDMGLSHTLGCLSELGKVFPCQRCRKWRRTGWRETKRGPAAWALMSTGPNVIVNFCYIMLWIVCVRL